jgi:GH15 family glucan-1,4-alpha-glucosidase
MYKKISDYGIIGNLHSVALIGSDASIDWLCLPHIDSPSVFGALLDDKKGGRFSISPLKEWDSVSEYIADTNILKTRFRTRSGVMQIIDFMPVPLGGEEELEEEEHELYRLVEISKGKVTIEMIFDPQFNYARSKTTIEIGENFIRAKANDESMVLSSTHRINVKSGLNWTPNPF